MDMIPERPEQKTEGYPSREASSAECPPRILLAEDDAELRALLAQALRKEGCEVVECPDGLELMEYVTSYLAHDKPIDVDLVISDIRMPWVTGMEVLRGMRQYLGYAPVILITAFGDDETHAEAKKLGVAAVFDKPFDIEELLLKVRELVSGDRGCDEQTPC